MTLCNMYCCLSIMCAFDTAANLHTITFRHNSKERRTVYLIIFSDCLSSRNNEFCRAIYSNNLNYQFRFPHISMKYLCNKPKMITKSFVSVLAIFLLLLLYYCYLCVKCRCNSIFIPGKKTKHFRFENRFI